MEGNSARVVRIGIGFGLSQAPKKRGPPCILWDDKNLTVPTAVPMEYIVACPDPARLAALCAFADRLQSLPDPRDRRGVRHPLPVRLGTLLVALAGGADSMAAVAAFTHDHRAWFRL